VRLHYPVHGTLSRACGRLMELLGLCPHANVGWPIRCGEEKMSSQHCCDCGAQRTYILQPDVHTGPWERPRLRSRYPLGVPFSSHLASGSIAPTTAA
jgi:hypothetical protein